MSLMLLVLKIFNDFGIFGIFYGVPFDVFLLLRYYSVKKLLARIFIYIVVYFCMSLDFLRCFIMVPEVGLEPTQGCPYQILSLTRLPVSPLGLS